MRKAFTVSMAGAAHVVECDYVGVVSGNDQVLHPSQARVLAPCSVLVVVHGDQVTGLLLQLVGADVINEDHEDKVPF